MTGSALSREEKLDWLRLTRTDNVGPITFYQLLRRYGTAAAALDALPELSRRGGRASALTPYPRHAAERELATLDAAGGELLAHDEAGYPQALAAIEDAPPVLFLLGHAHLLATRCIAIVGARNASANGRRLAQDLARDLGEAGLVVASGLARGIDASAHAGALATGTAAVIAGGLDVIYPKENEQLYHDIRAQGVLISEMPFATEPQARHFPRRNRIISGLCLGVVVVEAARRSGSLITARLALDQGREVFAVPGSPRDPRSHGPNGLLRQGAVLTERAEDVLEALEPMLRQPLTEREAIEYEAPPGPPPSQQEFDSAREIVTTCLSPTPVAVDEIIRQCHMTPAVVLMVLLELELAGRIERQPGNRVATI